MQILLAGEQRSNESSRDELMGVEVPDDDKVRRNLIRWTPSLKLFIQLSLWRGSGFSENIILQKTFDFGVSVVIRPQKSQTHVKRLGICIGRQHIK